jgi:hypothetical protein
LTSGSKLNGKSGSTEARVITTVGESFADGAMIELISGSSETSTPHLLLWNGRKTIVGHQVEHNGRIYQAPELPPSLYRATRFPSHCQGYGSARTLFDLLNDVILHHLDLPERESRLLACFSISTWLADRLPTAPSMAISGFDQELGMEVLRLLSCLCRHPLMLAEVTPGGFRSLRMQLPLTLLLMQQELKPNVQRLLRVSNYRGLHLPGNRGSLIDLSGPKAIFCGNDAATDNFGGGVIHISAVPSQLQFSLLDEDGLDKIANDFQPRLLMYRLKNSGKMRRGAVDVSEFTSATRSLASALAACFSEDSALARDTVQLLRPQDDEIRGQRSCDVTYAIFEILWGTIHERKQKALRVDELAKLVNALLRSRGETLSYSPEEIGWKLRDMNIARHNSSGGRQVLLGRDTCQSLERLARTYPVISTEGDAVKTSRSK